MQTQTVLAGSYGGNAYRFCLLPFETENFPAFPVFDSIIEVERMSLHRDPQGMLVARKKSSRFIFDPPTGNFRLSAGSTELVSGRLLTVEDGSPALQFRIESDFDIYGFGAANGNHDRNDTQFRMMNMDTVLNKYRSSTYSSFPFFLIRRKSDFVGVFLACSYPADVFVHRSERESIEPSVKLTIDSQGAIPVDCFVFSGSLPEILNQYSSITGRPFLPPAWALGFHQSRWSYKTQSRVMEIADRFRSEGLPCDVIHLDIHYMDRYRVFTWDSQRFPNPGEMHKKLNEQGIRSVAIVDPGVHAHKDYAIYNQGIAQNLFCTGANGQPYIGKVWPGKTAFPDFTRDDVQDWWAEKHESLFDRGVSGIWNDMNEPALKMGQFSNPFDEDIQHQEGSHRQFRNLYGYFEAKATNKAFATHKPDARPFVLTRSAFCGIQKYSALWTGDNHSTWQDLKENLNMVMNLGLSGVPMSGADVGGFARTGGQLGVIKIFKNSELFARWMELGSLMPFYRAHTALLSHSQEPWSFGQSILEISRKHMNRRYRLLPYLYSLFWESYRTGSPVVRPLFYEFPDCREGKDQFMLGPHLMAAPVFEPGQEFRSVYLPPGEWFEYESGQSYQGNRHVEFAAALGSYPLFIRAGAVIPVCKAERNAEESLQSALAFEIYPGSNLSGNLILDDFSSMAFLDGEVFEMNITGKKERNGNLNIQATVPTRKYQTVQSHISLRLPSGYKSIVYRSRKMEGSILQLMKEDRNLEMSTFELPLQGFRIEAVYRGRWDT